MLKTLQKKTKAGFTLVEIMIVVAIIALLASIAVPNFLRARQRSQATRILEDARILEGAKDQWAIETNQLGTAAVTHALIAPYLKAGSPLAQANADVLGNAYTLGQVNQPITVATASIGNFTVGTGTSDIFATEADKAKFWGGHAPGAGDDDED